MATQTKTQRQAAAKKAAATRKRNAAAQSGSRAKSSARSTASSARSTGRSAKTTAKQAARTGGRGADAATTRLEAVGRQAQRVLLIPLGAALEAGDRIAETASIYSNRTKAQRRLRQFERRGEQAFRRNRRTIEREARDLRREVERSADRATSEAGDRVRSLAS